MGLLSFVLGLVGCDAQRIAELEEGVATEADVARPLRRARKIWDAGDMAETPLPGAAAALGARTFEYNRQPQGTRELHDHDSADGKMSALVQVLTPQNFEKVLPGMRMEQVRKMLGKLDEGHALCAEAGNPLRLALPEPAPARRASSPWCLTPT